MDTFALFPDATPFSSGFIDCGDGHAIAFTERGNPAGTPIVLLHGGPGSGASPRQAAFFDPARFRIIQFDQRGSGHSRPTGGIDHNTTAHLIADIERLRRHLDLRRWIVAGGSWGATLAVIYAARHRPAVNGVLLRGFFLASRREIESFMTPPRGDHPEAWTRLLQTLPAWAHPQRTLWLAQVFRNGDALLQRTVATAWATWERGLSGLLAEWHPNPDELAALIQRYRVHSHYLLHGCWLGEAPVLRACRRLAGLPVLFLHGRNDAVCRPAAAWRAHRAVPGSELRWVEDVGHDPFHPAMAAAMRDGIADLVARAAPAPVNHKTRDILAIGAATAPWP